MSAMILFSQSKKFSAVESKTIQQPSRRLKVEASIAEQYEKHARMKKGLSLT
jgi:hypothetical protein